MAIPLHGKYAYVRVKAAGATSWNVISFATGYGFDLEQQNIARAIVMGTDGILDIQSQGLLASANIDMILTDEEGDIMTMLGASDLSADQEDGSTNIVDYVSKINDAIAGTAFDGTIKVDVQLIPLDNFKDFADAAILDANHHGYIFELQGAVLRRLGTRGSAGQYNVLNWSMETGHFKIKNLPT